MKDVLLVVVDENKNVIEEEAAFDETKDYNFDMLYYVIENELKFLSYNLQIPIDNYKYEYILNDENSSAKLVINTDINIIKNDIIKSIIETHYTFLKTGSQSVTYHKFETHLDELIEFWKKIDQCKKQIIFSLLQCNCFDDIKNVNFEWPAYSLM